MVNPPETGATLQGLDGAGNLTWSAQGLPASTACEPLGTSTPVAARKVARVYNNRNRLTALTFPDGIGDQTWTYTPDGLPDTITAYNDAGHTTPVVTAYHYNKRRMLDGQGETLTQPNWYTWGIGYGYDGNGNLSVQRYPTGLEISYSPNALGQATQAITPGASYATSATYHANGALKQFTYGNGIVHTMTQNARQLPLQVRSGTVTGYEYGYDANGNPTQLNDLVQGTSFSRYNQYDGLDRLTASGSVSYGGNQWHVFTYDAVDNLTSWTLGGVKDYAKYVYDASNRLTSIKNTSGVQQVGLSYDLQGNLASKNGKTARFDYGNRLRAMDAQGAGLEAYRYDAMGRRVLAWRSADNTTTLSQYSQAGQLLYQENTKTAIVSEHVYLAGSLITTRERAWSSATIVPKYQHTDALGSPVAVTGQNGQLIERTQWEPYGAAIGKPAYDGVGYTGHVVDGATGLTYMQQRYYDPQIGRFLSVDPVTANSSTGANFNRYWYANNSPYKFNDPDGRLAITPPGLGSNCDLRWCEQERVQNSKMPAFQRQNRTPSKPAGEVRSNPEETRAEYVLRLGKIVRQKIDETGFEVCGEICSAPDSTLSTKLRISQSHVTCDVPAICSGKTMHGHGPRYFRVNGYDKSYLESIGIYREVGSRFTGQNRNMFSAVDFSKPGYLAGDTGVYEQNGRGSESYVGDYP